MLSQTIREEKLKLDDSD